MRPSRQVLPDAGRPRLIQIPELMTAKDLESLLKIDVKAIYSYVQRGLIPYVRIQSNVRFRRTEIVEWVESQTFRPRGVGAQSNAGASSRSLSDWRRS